LSFGFDRREAFELERTAGALAARSGTARAPCTAATSGTGAPTSSHAGTSRGSGTTDAASSCTRGDRASGVTRLATRPRLAAPSGITSRANRHTAGATSLSARDFSLSARRRTYGASSRIDGAVRLRRRGFIGATLPSGDGHDE
jgi:hypothetical protein